MVRTIFSAVQFISAACWGPSAIFQRAQMNKMACRRGQPEKEASAAAVVGACLSSKLTTEDGFAGLGLRNF